MCSATPEGAAKDVSVVEGETVLRLDAVGSTMDAAERLAHRGQVGIIVAVRQTAGRGRFGRRWLSPEGGLYLSWVLRLPRRAERHIWQLAGLAAVRVLRKTGVSRCGLKLPNDIITDTGKLAGLIVERRGPAVIIGLGVNVNADTAETGEGSTSIRTLTGRRTDIEEVLRGFIRGFHDVLKDFAAHPEALLAEWSGYLKT